MKDLVEGDRVADQLSQTSEGEVLEEMLNHVAPQSGDHARVHGEQLLADQLQDVPKVSENSVGYDHYTTTVKTTYFFPVFSRYGFRSRSLRNAKASSIGAVAYE